MPTNETRYALAEEPIASGIREGFFTSGGRESITLDTDHLDNLVRWCRSELVPRKTANRNARSYALKHVAERQVGYYVSNADMKLALWIAGFYPEDPAKSDWVFGASDRSNALSHRDASTWRRIPHELADARVNVDEEGVLDAM